MSDRYNSLKNTDISVLAAWVILLFTLTPFLLLCMYSVPLGDDFWYADGFRKHGMMGTQISWYKEWSGRYMATFLISTLNPVSYGHLNLGFLHPLVLLSGTVISLKFLTDTIVNYFNLPVSKLLSLSIIIFFYLNFLPDLGESFYWMAGAYTYQVPVIFLFLYIGILIRTFSQTSLTRIIFYMALAMLCLFVILGSNEVIVVYVGFLNFIIAMWLWFGNRKIFLRFLPILVITAILSYLMIFAEGNFARAELFEKPSFHLLKSIVNSLSRGLFVLFFWIPALMILLLSIRGISEIKISENFIPKKIINHRTLAIGAVLFLILIVFIGFFPSIYATKWIPQRAYTPIFAVFMIVFIFMFVSLIKHFPVLSRVNHSLSGIPGTSMTILCVLILALSHNSNVMNGYVDLTSGKAASHHNQAMNTYYELETTTADTIYVKELVKRPLIMPIRWPQKHNQLANTIWEEYFGVKNVELD